MTLTRINESTIDTSLSLSEWVKVLQKDIECGHILRNKIQCIIASVCKKFKTRCLREPQPLPTASSFDIMPKIVIRRKHMQNQYLLDTAWPIRIHISNVSHENRNTSTGRLV